MKESECVFGKRIERHWPKWFTYRTGEKYMQSRMPLEFSDNCIDVIDHPRHFKDESGKITFTTQPYGPLRYEDIKSMVETCEKNNIGFNIHAYSPHYPGATIMIEWFQRPSDD